MTGRESGSNSGALRDRRWLKPREAAEYYGVSVQQIYAHYRAGKIIGDTEFGDLRIDRETTDKLRDERKQRRKAQNDFYLLVNFGKSD